MYEIKEKKGKKKLDYVVFNISFQYLFFRYLANGVWDMYAVRTRKHVVTYLCCPEPYPELHYLLVFKRHPAFYIYYMVLPCLFLSVLSLLVFYLPPDCGEKLTLSITNLLALVVFQQIIAENMPPSDDESPIIGKLSLTINARVKEHLEPTYRKSSPLFTFSTKSLGQDSLSVHLFSKKLGQDSPARK